MVKVILKLDEKNDQFITQGVSVCGYKVNNRNLGVAVDKVYTALNKGEINPNLYEGL